MHGLYWKKDDNANGRYVIMKLCRNKPYAYDTKLNPVVAIILLAKPTHIVIVSYIDP